MSRPFCYNFVKSERVFQMSCRFRLAETAVLAAGVVVFAAGFSLADEPSPVARIGATTYTSLVSAIQGSQAGDVIELTADVEEALAATAQVSFAPIGHDLTITSADGVRRTIYATNTKGYSFNVTAGTLTFSNVVLRSASRSTGSYDMYLHATGSGTKVVFGEDFLMSGITNAGGHAVCYWESFATLEMKPGAEVRDLRANYGHLRFSKATFDFTGGLIADCYGNSGEGSPVYLYGGATLNMSGGTITGCRCAKSNVAVGAVFLHNSSVNTLNLSGGAITNNFVAGVWADEANVASPGTVCLSGDAVVKDNAGGDIVLKLDNGLTLGGAFEGYATVTNVSAGAQVAEGVKIGRNANWQRGACNVRCAGNEDWQLRMAQNGDLVWGCRPVRVGGTLYRTMYEAMEAAPDVATFEILTDNPEFRDPVVRTNVTWRFQGVGGQKTLTWPSNLCAFYLRTSDVVLNDVVLTAAKTINASSVSGVSNQYFINLAGGNLTLEQGGGVTNVTISKHAVLALGHDGLTSGTYSAGPTTFTMEEGSVLSGLKSNYGALRFEGSSDTAIFVMRGGAIADCTSNSGEGSPVYFLTGGRMTMTGGAISGNRCTKDSAKAATIWNNNGGAFTFDFSGGTIENNANTADLMNREDASGNYAIRVRLGGTATVGAPGFRLDRMPSGTGRTLMDVADDYAGSCTFVTTDRLLPSPAETVAFGLCTVESARHLVWANAADRTDYRLTSLGGGLGAFAAASATDDEALGDNVAWSGAGLQTSLAAAVAAVLNGGSVCLLRDVTLTEPFGTPHSTTSYTLDGRGHAITCANTNLFNAIRGNVTLKNMTVTGNRGRNSVFVSGRLTLGKGFVFRDFAATWYGSYASFVANDTSVVSIEDGAVIEDGLSQVGVFRAEGSGAKVVMNGGVVRNISFDPTSAYRNEAAVVQVLNGAFEMNGGVISNCIWNAAAGLPDFAGVVYLNPTIRDGYARCFRMTGGRIVGNTAGVWCGAGSGTIEISGTATIADNVVRDLSMGAADILSLTGDFTGDVVVTEPFGARGTAFGTYVAGTGAERFRHGKKFGRVADGVLEWWSEDGTLLLVR